jgi:hypothetical protein
VYVNFQAIWHKAYFDDLEATAEERLAFFERLTFQSKQAGVRAAE